MKAVPILVLTNALALGLGIFLLVDREEATPTRSESYRGGTVDVASLEMRIAVLERQLAEARAGGRLPTADASAATLDAGGPAAAATGEVPTTSAPTEGGEPAADTAPEEFDSAEMEVFRRKVAKAIELNDDEAAVRRVAERIDALVEQNRIAPLSDKQKEQVAHTMMDYRREMPNVWRKLRENGTLESASREERGQLIRAEYDKMRLEAQRALEALELPAADAKVILDEAMMGGDMRGLGGFGPARPSQRGSR